MSFERKNWIKAAFLLGIYRTAQKTGNLADDLLIPDNVVQMEGQDWLVFEIREITPSRKEITLLGDDDSTKEVVVQSINGNWEYVGEAGLVEDVVEEPTPEITPPNFTIPVKGRDYTFFEGEDYWNHKGAYKVQSINPEKRTMVVEYTDGEYVGTTQELDMLGAAKIMDNQKVREDREVGMRKLDLQSEDEAFTLGYLASKGTIQVRVLEHNQQSFETAYERLTGDNLDALRNKKHYFIRPEGSPGDSFQIHFSYPDQSIIDALTFGEGRDPLHTDFGGQYHSKNYIWNLFHIGFKIGRNVDNIPQIRQRVKEKDRFDYGVAISPTAGLEAVASFHVNEEGFNTHVVHFV